VSANVDRAKFEGLEKELAAAMAVGWLGGEGEAS
jgi:hypothetical protein